MRKKDRNALLLGALAGAVVGYWLNSDQGRKTRSKVVEATAESYGQVKTVAVDQYDTAKVKATDVMAQGLEMSKSALDQVKSTATNVTENIQNSFAKGVEKAQRNIDEVEKELLNESSVTV